MKNKLINYTKRIDSLNYLITVLRWEMDTIAPSMSFDYLINQLNYLEDELFKTETSEEYIKLLEDFISSDEFNNISEEEKRFINRSKDEYYRLKRVPNSFYLEYTKLRSESLNTWVNAKNENNYSLFKPYLIKIIDYTKKLYKYMYPNNNNLYDCMLSTYEEGINSNLIDKLFEELKNEIIPIIRNLKNSNIKPLNIELDTDKYMEISKYLLNYIGFDNNRGALGIYSHGYTTKLNDNDVRIVFPKNKDIIDHMCTIIHEGGHGIFEQNLGESLKTYPNYYIDKTALHESQSRFYENILGRNINFWIPIYDDIKKILNINIDINDFIKLFNNAHPSFIRTRADELTYCLHIIIRYEIEKDIFNGNIDLNNIDKVWNQKYKEYLNLDVKEDKDGILQDMHWSDGNFGYFPTYLLGSIFDGMLLDHINDKVGDIDTLLKNGEIKKITKYLNENIHKYGGAYNINEVSNRLTNKNLEVGPIIKYFKEKYDNKV